MPKLKGLYQAMRGKDAIKRPTAGVGMPIKYVFCLVVVTLNLANLKAAKQAIRKAGVVASMLTSIALGCFIYAVQRSLNMIIAGATPKLTRSASESRSCPTGENIFSARAARPSSKSQIAAMNINKLPR